MSADSLIGVVQGARRAIAVSGIVSVEVKRGDTVKTALFVAGIAIAVLVALYYAGCRCQECPLGARHPPPGP